MRRLLVAYALVCVCACEDAAPDAGAPDAGWVLADAAQPYESELWPVREAPVPWAGFASRHPDAFFRISRWSQQVEGEDRPDVGHRGAFGVGNGHVFALLGLADPLNTLHGTAGPTYEKGERFFGDYPLSLVPAGERTPAAFEAEWAARALSSPVALTSARRGVLDLATFDFAPWSDDPEAQRCLVRVVVARNRGEAASEPVDLLVRPYQQAEVDGETLVEVAGPRRLRTGFLTFGAQAHPRYLALPLGALGPGEEAERVLLLCASQGEAPAALPRLDADALLDETTQRFSAWAADLVQIDVPDPMVADFLDGMKLTLKVQTAATGASCPMSRYGSTWTRDNVGPLLAWLIMGAHEDAAAQVDYLDGAIRKRGGLSNSYPADLDLSELPEEPDWDRTEPPSGRTAAETPSYLVWMYDLLRSWGPYSERYYDRVTLLHYCLREQAFGPDRLLPWTGDETFRAAMNAAFGLDLEYPHQDRTWSLNSSLLWLAAARSYGYMGRELVEASTLARYRLPDGCLAAYLDRETLEPAPGPFEDVALKALWAGWLDGDDPRAAEQLACLIDRAGVAPGVLQSPLHSRYQGTGILGGAQAVHTGMLPGYTLVALARAGHPDAEAAFEAVRPNLSPSGNVQEYHVYPDHSGLSLLYDASGTLGDYTARFRPWEGGIVAHAAVAYLTGFGPSLRGPGYESVSIRPHLPAGWDRMRFEGLRLGAYRFDLDVVRRPGYVDATVRPSGAALVFFRWDLRPGEPGDLGVLGAEYHGEVTRREHFGVRSVEVEANVAQDTPVTFRVASP